LNLNDLNEIPPWEWPEDAASMVLTALKDRKAIEIDRLLAAELAGDLVILSEEVADALLDIIRSNEETAELRSSAAIALGPGLEEAELGDYSDPDDAPAFSESFLQKIQRTFHALYLNPGVGTDVRRSILEASVRNPQDWHTPAIQDAYVKDDMDWRLTAVFCMRFVKGFEKEILAALNSADPRIHYNAVEAAGNWELDAAWPHIAQLVTEPKTEKLLRLAAIWAAASIRPHESDIIEPLVDSYDEDISEAAMDALTEAGFAAEWEEEEDEDYCFEEDQDEDEEDLKK
jgi:hypothetical protein